MLPHPHLTFLDAIKFMLICSFSRKKWKDNTHRARICLVTILSIVGPTKGERKSRGLLNIMQASALSAVICYQSASGGISSNNTKGELFRKGKHKSVAAPNYGT